MLTSRWLIFAPVANPFLPLTQRTFLVRHFCFDFHEASAFFALCCDFEESWACYADGVSFVCFKFFVVHLVFYPKELGGISVALIVTGNY